MGSTIGLSIITIIILAMTMTIVVVTCSVIYSFTGVVNTLQIIFMKKPSFGGIVSRLQIIFMKKLSFGGMVNTLRRSSKVVVTWNGACAVSVWHIF